MRSVQTVKLQPIRFTLQMRTASRLVIFMGNIGVGPNSGLGRMIREFGHSKEGNAKPAANYEDEKKAIDKFHSPGNHE